MAIQRCNPISKDLGSCVNNLPGDIQYFINVVETKLRFIGIKAINEDVIQVDNFQYMDNKWVVRWIIECNGDSFVFKQMINLSELDTFIIETPRLIEQVANNCADNIIRLMDEHFRKQNTRRVIVEKIHK